MNPHVSVRTALCVLPAVLCLWAGTARSQYLEATVSVGIRPNRVLWNPTSNKVYAMSSEDNAVAILSGASNQVLTTVSVSEWPMELAWNSRDNKVYATCGDGSRVAVICGYGDTLIKRVHVSGCPSRMAYCATLNKLYVGRMDDNSITVLDAGPDTVLTEVPLPSQPYTFMWHPMSNRVFCSVWGFDDSVMVLDCATDRIVERLAPGGDPYAWCWDPVSGFAYVAGSYGVYVLSPGGDSIVDSVPLSGYANWVSCIVPELNKVYVGDWNPGGAVSIVDCVTYTVLDTFCHPGGVKDLLYDATHRKWYCAAGYEMHVYEASTDSLIVTFMPGYCGALARNAHDSRVYAVAFGLRLVYVVRDTTTGVEEGRQLAASSSRVTPTVVRGVLNLTAPRTQDTEHRAELLDAAGRKVTDLHSGANDVRHLPAGVYFVREARAQAQAVRKVVVTR